MPQQGEQRITGAVA
jgi:hypothetical protein